MDAGMPQALDDESDGGAEFGDNDADDYKLTWEHHWIEINMASVEPTGT